MELEDKPNSQTLKTWLGSSISEICRGKGPWSFAISPVNASKYHTVLYQLPVTLISPPKPHKHSQPLHWDEDHVRMPFSEKNLFPVIENGIDVVKLRWNIIQQSLSKPITNSRDLEKAILSYNNSLPKFSALHYFFDEILEEDESKHFFNYLLPEIIKLALQLPELLPGSFPLLKKNHNRSLSLSQEQIACLLANAFLCTFPWKKDVASCYPGVNFVRLFAAHARPKRYNCIAEKFKCIFHYFRRITQKKPIGVVTFERKFVPKGSMPRWDNADNNLGNTKIHINSSGTIEDGLGFLQVDFANKNVGGGVLGYGCVQEEIRFVICPELIISRLFVEQLGDNEAVTVIGTERYCKYSGYGDSFQWDGNFEDETPFDEYGRRRTSICIIDATRFNRPKDQFFPSAMLRELNKAFVGFSSREKDNLAPVATGNWGCGAFKGSSNLKSLIQLMACSSAGRDLVYYSFGDEDLRDEFYSIYLFLANNRITITQLWRYLSGFSTSGLMQDRLYAYIQQAHFDSKNQPTIKMFFDKTAKKRENDVPSTSSSSKCKNLNKNSLKVNKDPDKKLARITRRKESVEINLEGIEDLYDDIIPATPPSELIHKNKQKKIHSKLSQEEITKKLPKTDIADLIDKIDGRVNKPKDIIKEDSLLTELDKLRKKSKNYDFEESSSRETKELYQKMEIDDSVSDDSTLDTLSPSLSSENAALKKRITDYFQVKPSKYS